jgi:hypothetical protein
VVDRPITTVWIGQRRIDRVSAYAADPVVSIGQLEHVDSLRTDGILASTPSVFVVHCALRMATCPFSRSSIDQFPVCIRISLGPLSRRPLIFGRRICTTRLPLFLNPISVADCILSLIVKDLISSSEVISPLAGSDRVGVSATVLMLPFSGTCQAASLSSSSPPAVEGVLAEGFNNPAH